LNRANKVGIAAAIGAGLCFVSNDALVKHISAQLASAQLIFIRGVFASLMLYVVGRMAFKQSDYRAVFCLPVLRRAALDAIATLAYLSALAFIPLGNATAINMAAPIFIAAGAAVIFKEEVSRFRWLLILMGFAGVLMVIQPRADGFNQYAWICLGATLLHSLRDLSTRTIPRAIPSLVVTMATALAVTILAGLYSIFQGWKPLDLGSIISLALASSFLSIAYFLIVKSMRVGDMSVISPFRYSALPFALLLGYLVWHDVPNFLAWTGIGFLLVSGVLMLRGQR
jgi:drug/metabolite transporter (DMT)-like permease